MIRLFELGTRPWEAKTKEEAERIARYEAYCRRAATKASIQEDRIFVKNRLS